MTDNHSFEETLSLWQNQQSGDFQMSFDLLNQSAQRLNRKLQRGKLLLYFIGLFEIVAFTLFIFLVHSPMERAGACLTIIGMSFLIGQIWLNRRDSRIYSTTAMALGLTNPVLFYRAELERQRNFHRGKWFWSRLVVFTPGPVLFTIGGAIAHPEQTAFYLVICAVMLVLMVIAIPLNLRQSRKYQRKIDALDALQRAPESPASSSLHPRNKSGVNFVLRFIAARARLLARIRRASM